jgi:hypothetical protein
MTAAPHVYEVRPRKDKRGVELISDALPFGRLSYGEPNAISNGNRLRRVSASAAMRFQKKLVDQVALG